MPDEHEDPQIEDGTTDTRPLLTGHQAWIMKGLTDLSIQINKIGDRIDKIDARLRKTENKITWWIGVAAGVVILVALLQFTANIALNFFEVSITPIKG